MKWKGETVDKSKTEMTEEIKDVDLSSISHVVLKRKKTYLYNIYTILNKMYSQCC